MRKLSIACLIIFVFMLILSGCDNNDAFNYFGNTSLSEYNSQENSSEENASASENTAKNEETSDSKEQDNWTALY